MTLVFPHAFSLYISIRFQIQPCGTAISLASSTRSPGESTITCLILSRQDFKDHSQRRRGLRRRSAASRLLRCVFDSHRGYGYLSHVSVVK
jgi:hypothetical protein